MTHQPSATYDMTGLGFLADDVVFAVGAASRGRVLDADDRMALDNAITVLTALATLDDDDDVKPEPATGRMRELVASRRHVIQAARVGGAPSAKVRETLLEMSGKLEELREHPTAEHDVDEYRAVLDFFEGLSRLSLSEVRRVTEGTQLAWTSSLSTGLY